MSAPPIDPVDPAGSGDAIQPTRDDADSDSEVAHLRARVRELEAALEQKDAELEAVRNQYEAILQERTAGADPA